MSLNKFNTIFSIVLFVLFSGAFASGGENLLKNGGFETIKSGTNLPDGWGIDPTDIASKRVELDPDSAGGKHSLKISRREGDNQAFISQGIVRAEGGRDYVMKCWVKTSGKANAFFYVSLSSLVDGKNQEIKQAESKKQSPSYTDQANWTPMAWKFSTPSGTKYVYISVTLRNAGGAGEAWFDDVELNELSDEKSAAAGWPWLKYGIAPNTNNNPACVPAQRTDWALNYHKGTLELENKEKVTVLFLGDSIMNEMYPSRSLVYAERVKAGGNQVWQKYYEPLRAANFGISADETGNLLWRITEGGCLEALHPKVVVLLIGINNLIRGQAPEQTAEGIAAIVGYLKNKLPDTKILLLGVFPCWQPASNPIRAKVKQTNLLISPLHDGQRIFYLDVGYVFVEPDGAILKEKLQDTLHPSEKGYALWAEAMQPYLADLLNNGGKGEMWKKEKAGQ